MSRRGRQDAPLLPLGTTSGRRWIGAAWVAAAADRWLAVLPTALIEFLIPVTIVATCIENLAVRDRERTPLTWRYRPVLAAVFGLVHGAGFANYLRSRFMDRIAVPLFGFNIGIEAGQIVVLAAAAILLATVDRALGAARRLAGSGAPPSLTWTPLRLRAVGVSLAVGVVATRWAVERFP